MANKYTKGTLVRMQASFSVVGGSASDPTTVAASVKDPTGALSSPQVVRDGIGAYHADFTPSLPGVHYYRFTGTGGLTVAAEGAFVVVLSNF